MMLEQIRRWRWTVLGVAALLAGLAYALWPEAVAVDSAEVTRGPMQVGITDDGVTRAEEYYVVSAPVTGYLRRIELEAGDPIARGTLITRMSGRPTTPLDLRTRQELQGALQAAQAAVRGAQASLEQDRRDLARAEELAGRGFLSRARLEAARTQVTNDEATLAGAQAEAARVRALLAGGGAVSGDAVPVRAPAGGFVLAVINESEGVIAEGTPLMTIGDPARIEAVVDLLSRDAVQVHPGARVEITQWGGARPLTGQVERIEPFGRLKISALGIEEQRVNTVISFDNLSAGDAARLGHGYQIDATIVLWSDAKALRVPIGAIFRSEDGGWQVLAIIGGRARLRKVSIGRLNDSYGQVLSGLEEGERVIINPGAALTDGTRVRAR